MLILSVTITFLMLGVLWLAAVLHEHGLKPMRGMAELMKRPAAEVALVALVAIGMIHHGATKGTNGVNGAGGEMGGTNGVMEAGGNLSRGAAENTEVVESGGVGSGGVNSPTHPLTHSPTTNYQLPTTNSDWLAFGGYEDWFYLDGGGWCFRFGSNLVERLTVVSCGEISPAPYDESNRISLLGLPLAILPAANWHLLGNGEQGTGNGEQGNYQLPTTNYQLKSLFWHEETPSNTLLLTWRNALVNRDTDLPVTVQAELFPDGTAAFRYDFSGIGDVNALSNAEAQIWRDGVLATNYQLPTIDYQLSTTNYQLSSFFDAPPITGTNLLAEVYARIAGGNSNAYYCADVVVEKGPAKIRVEPLGVETNQGLLGTYEIVAMPGETNRLPLLIGPKYAVTAESAFRAFDLVPPPFVPLADDTGTVERLSFGDAFSATNITDRLLEVQWPVVYWLKAIDATPEAATYELRVSPDWLDGVLSWYDIADTNAPPMRGTPPMRSGGSSCSCGCLARDSDYLIHSLICLCDRCYAEGELVYEAFSQRISLDMKEPQGGGEPDGSGDPGSGTEPSDEPWVSVKFEKDVVIFEAPYEVEPGVTNSPSTLTKLTISVYGGENGVTLEPLIGEGKIQLVETSDMMPTSVLPFTRVDWEGYYKGIAENSENDRAVASVLLKDAETGGGVDFAFDFVTVVRINVAPTINPPCGHMPYRRKFGVLEVVSCEQFPSSPKVSWTYNSGSHHTEDPSYYYHCPLVAAENPLHASIGNVEHTPDLTVIAPQGVEARQVIHNCKTNHLGEAGWTGMYMKLYVLPMDVSFSNIAIEEVPCDRGIRNGYFTHVDFSDMSSHTRSNGAGTWCEVDSENGFMDDDASIDGLPRMRWDHVIVNYPDPSVGWLSGYFSWDIPYGWNDKTVVESNPLAAPYGQFALDTKHEVILVPDGTVSLWKLGNYATRTTNDVIYLNGELQ